MAEAMSRNIFDRIKEDSSSLVINVDSESFLTKQTQDTFSTSKLSMNFTFDNELLQHRLYKSTLRSLMRKALRFNRDNSRLQGRLGAKEKPINPSWRISVLFAGDLAHHTLMSILYTNSFNLSSDDCVNFRKPILLHLVNEVQDCMSLLSATSDVSEIKGFWKYYEILNGNDHIVHSPLSSQVEESLRWFAGETRVFTKMRYPAS
jgi:hypothetical protein